MPNHLKDYFCNTVFLNSVTDCCFTTSPQPTVPSFVGLSIPSQITLKLVSDIIKLTTYS